MKNYLKKAALVTGMIVTLSSGATAQQFGVGVGITGNSSSVVSGVVGLNEEMRLAPYIAFQTQSEPSSTDFRVGTAFHMLHGASEKVKLYYGAFAGVSYSQIDTGRKVSTTLLELGPVGGVEYALDKQFTLGAEVSLDMAFGDKTVVTTNSMALIRYYF
jgi:hypothetical protein